MKDRDEMLREAGIPQEMIDMTNETNRMSLKKVELLREREGVVAAIRKNRDTYSTLHKIDAQLKELENVKLCQK